MPITAVRVSETFESLQGESTRAGLPCFFIRLAGCNLRCRYCDTALARVKGNIRGVDELLAECRRSRAPLVEITGGEPLLQNGFPALAAALRDGSGKDVLVETNGTRDLSLVPAGVTAVVDVKCPGSGAGGTFDPRNVERLRCSDEVKFVLTGRSDYEWALAFEREAALHRRCRAVLFSPARGELDAAELARWLIDDAPPARLQVPLHPLLGLR